MRLFFALKCILTSVRIRIFSFKPKPTLLRSPSLLKLQLLMLKVVATMPAEALRRLLAMMAAREQSAREEMPAAIVGPPTDPRRPKTKPWGLFSPCSWRGVRAVVV